VSPDIVIQLSNEYGIIAEIKITGSNDRDFENAYEQLKRYDRDLIGWETENSKIKTHDISLLVNDLKRTDAKRYFDDKTLQRKFSLVACARISEAKEYCKIEKYHGSYSDERLEKKFRDPIPVPLEKIISKISAVKFYDADPPVEYTMNVLWMNVFNELMARDGAGKMIAVSCKEVTKLLEEKYAFKQVDSKQPKIPKEAWIRNALDVFVKIKLAKKDPTKNNVYLVKYSRTKKTNMIDLFSKKHFEVKSKKEQKSSDHEQKELPFESDENN
jgi:hypothetical protein